MTDDKTQTNQDGTAPLAAGVDPKTVSDDAPNGRTDGAAGEPQLGRTLDFPTGIPADYDAVTEGQKADEERFHNAAVSPDADGAEVVKAGDQISDSLFEGEGDFVTLTKDVVEEFYFPDTTRPSHKLLFSKGQVVRRSDIEALNARIEETRAVAGGDAPVDSTTAAYEAEQEKVDEAAEKAEGDGDADDAPAAPKRSTSKRAAAKK